VAHIVADVVVAVAVVIVVVAAVVVNDIAAIQRTSGPFGDLANDALGAAIVDYSVKGNVVHVLVGG